MQHNDLNTIYGVALWICSILLSIVNVTIPYDNSWLDITLEVLSKLSPLISTFFIYIINKKEIDKFFKEKIKRNKR